MRKTQKNVLGLLGLFLVVAITAIAAFLPDLGASAVSSMTDNITVRVVGATPNVDIDGIESGSVITVPEQSFTANYENVENIKIELIYTAPDGTESRTVIIDQEVGPDAGSINFDINFRESGYPYGDYTLVATGTGYDGATDEDLIEFTYAPFRASLDEDEANNKTYVDLDYGDNDGTNTDIDKIIINVYDKDGNIIEELSNIVVIPPTNRVNLPFEKYDLESGDYPIVVTAYDDEGNAIHSQVLTKTIKKKDDEVIPVPDTNAPDTGGFLKNLNVSKADFLITALLVFFVAAIAAIVFIVRRNKHSNKRR